MTQTTPRRNRGPAAAAENRAAILNAARKLFAERGYEVPLIAIAKEAGVGQGVLYRHFPTRLTLAFAVFEEHFKQYAEIAAKPTPQAFGELWQALVDNVITQSAFIDMVADARQNHPDYDGPRRLVEILQGPLARAQAAGLITPDVTVDEVTVAIRMAYGIARTAEPSTNVDEIRHTITKAIPRLNSQTSSS